MTNKTHDKLLLQIGFAVYDILEKQVTSPSESLDDLWNMLFAASREQSKEEYISVDEHWAAVDKDLKIIHNIFTENSLVGVDPQETLIDLMAELALIKAKVSAKIQRFETTIAKLRERASQDDEQIDVLQGLVQSCPGLMAKFDAELDRISKQEKQA